MADKANEQKILKYKGKPLMRKGKDLYYGNVDDKFRVHLEIDENTTVKDIVSKLKEHGLNASFDEKNQTDDVTEPKIKRISELDFGYPFL